MICCSKPQMHITRIWELHPNYEYNDTYSGQHIDPEISEQTVLDVVFYLRTLKAPVQSNQDDADVQNGRQIFRQYRLCQMSCSTITNRSFVYCSY